MSLVRYLSALLLTAFLFFLVTPLVLSLIHI